MSTWSMVSLSTPHDRQLKSKSTPRHWRFPRTSKKWDTTRQENLYAPLEFPPCHLRESQRWWGRRTLVLCSITIRIIMNLKWWWWCWSNNCFTWVFHLRRTYKLMCFNDDKDYGDNNIRLWRWISKENQNCKWQLLWKMIIGNEFC